MICRLLLPASFVVPARGVPCVERSRVERERAAPLREARFGIGLVVLGLSLVLGACGANHNEEERHRHARARGLLPSDDCIATCLETPKPKRVDCDTPLEGLEFFPIIDIDQNVATIYRYDDKTTSLGEVSRGWEPASVNMNRCKGDDEDDNPNHVMELRGGPYIDYGGGAGRSLNTENIPEDVRLPISTEFGKWARDASDWEGVSFWARRGIESQAGFRVAIGDKYVDDDLAYVDYYNRALDKPQSEAHPRGDRVYCRRERECGCPLSKPCTFYEGIETGANAGYYCYDPDVDLEPFSKKPSDPDDIPPGTRFTLPTGSDEPEVEHDRCGSTACNRFYPAFEGKQDYLPSESVDSGYCPPGVDCDSGEPWPQGVFDGNGGYDPEFYGRACTPYTQSNGKTIEYCYDPGKDPPPPESDELCGDNRYAPVRLTTEWEFYKVPFSEMLQYGYAKESFALDLENVATVRFTWDRGWIEFWVDDVAFYRHVER